MNYTEKYIWQFYQKIDIDNPLLLKIGLIIDYLKLEVTYWPHSSAIASYDDNYILFLNDQLSMQQQWQDFGHEMYHYCHDYVVYDRLHEAYADYGESKADYFAYHFCVPTFMLLELKEVSVDVITRLFNVEFDFAYRRLEMYSNKCLRGGIYEKS